MATTLSQTGYKKMKALSSILGTIVAAALLYTLYVHFDGDLAAIANAIYNIVATIFLKVSEFFSNKVFPALGL